MDVMFSGLETKFTNVIRRIDSDIKSLWRSSDVLNKKFNTLSSDLDDIKAQIPVFVSKPVKPTEEKDVSTVILQYFGALIEKCVTLYNENQKLAVGLFLCVCIYNVLSLFTYISVCIYVCGKKRGEKKCDQKSENGEKDDVCDEKEKDLPTPDRNSPSPPPLPQSDIPEIIEIRPNIGACFCVGADLPPRPPMRSFSLPMNYQRMRARSGLPSREEFMQRLTPVSSPVLPRAVVQPN
ncbi:hypothetical protein, partial [Aeromonas sobria]|uniref:hypothetical protein n=1 Tax=Aeromonas sobria TaxID=646 RepID=UPI003F37FB65